MYFFIISPPLLTIVARRSPWGADHEQRPPTGPVEVETPPWDIGRPQAPFIELADDGRLRGRVLDPGAAYYMLCFSDRVPGDAGPRRIRQDEIRSVFAEGFSVDAITESWIEATFLDLPVPAWLATITR